MNDALVLNINLDQCNPAQHMQKACGPDPTLVHPSHSMIYFFFFFYGQSFSSFITLSEILSWVHL